jgi:methyltransferase (TIGR00027 family)
VIIRTRFYDDYLVSAAAAGIRQMILLGAGLDARAFRLDLPSSTVVFEVDLPRVLVAKQSVLDEAGAVPVGDRRVVGADLTEPITPALLGAGLDPNRPIAWLAEGVLVYLEPAHGHRMLVELTELSVSDSLFASESGSRRPPDATAHGVETLWKSGGDDGPDTILPSLGWSVVIHRLADVAADYGRPIRTESISSFVTAARH